MGNMHESTCLYGVYHIEIIDTWTGKKTIYNLLNQLTYLNRDIHLAMLYGVTDDFSFEDLNGKYFSFGGNSTPANAGQTKLIDERHRKQITQKSYIKGNNFVESIVSLTTAESNFRIREIGIFGGNATTVKDSGRMLSRIVVDIDKFENMVVNIIRRDIVNI